MVQVDIRHDKEIMKSPKSQKRAKRWKCPKWLKRFFPYLAVRDVDSLEDLMNDHVTCVQVNAPRALMCVAVHHQVMLLTWLQRDGLLKDTGKKRSEVVEMGLAATVLWAKAYAIEKELQAVKEDE